MKDFLVTASNILSNRKRIPFYGSKADRLEADFSSAAFLTSITSGTISPLPLVSPWRSDICSYLSSSTERTSSNNFIFIVMEENTEF
jgi:hypothetical protein